MAHQSASFASRNALFQQSVAVLPASLHLAAVFVRQTLQETHRSRVAVLGEFAMTCDARSLWQC
jgi:hypothetical protein